MKRVLVTPRENWQRRVEQLGLTFHSIDGRPYWDESVCYQFTAAEIDTLEAATEELQKLCLKAGQFIIDRNRFDALAIPPAAREAIRQTWESEPPSLYGRFDLFYDGSGPPKLLEYNANTPTGLLEAAVVQWDWRADVFPATDQFNSIHEKLISKWSELRRHLRSRTVHFTCMPNDENLMTVTYLRDTAQQAGLTTKHLFVREIGWQRRDSTFRDLNEQVIHTMFSLYPWEWLLSDAGAEILPSMSKMDWIEPIWKMLGSNKGLLAILWEIFRIIRICFPRILRSRTGCAILSASRYCRGKARTLLSLWETGVFIPMVPIAAGLLCIRRWLPVGIQTVPWLCWEAVYHGPGTAGMGIRELVGVTTNCSRFVPHYFA